MVEAYDVGASGQNPACLAASGSKLISGSSGNRSVIECEVRVWDVDSLTCEHTVRQPAGADVNCVAVLGGEGWGGMGWIVLCIVEITMNDDPNNNEQE